MTRNLVAAALAAVMFASPAIALAQTPDSTAPATGMDAPKKHKKHHKKAAAPAPDAAAAPATK